MGLGDLSAIDYDQANENLGTQQLAEAIKFNQIQNRNLNADTDSIQDAKMRNI